MKPGLVYGIIFFVVFLLVTAGMYYITENQPELLLVHIPGISKESEENSDTSHVVQKSLRLELQEDLIPEEDFYAFMQDSSKKMPRKTVVEVKHDTIIQKVKYDNPALLDSIKYVEKLLAEAKSQIKNRDSQIENLKRRIIKSRDSTYNAWVKNTVKMYEAMKPQVAAKLIDKYSDNEARDLIYAMKKKKAADVLAYLNEETVTKLTRSK